MTDTEKLRLGIRGILDAYELMTAPSDLSEFLDGNAMEQSRIDQILQACKEAGLKFVPHLRIPLIDDYKRNEGNAYNTPNEIYQQGQARMLGKVLAISSQIKEIEV